MGIIKRFSFNLVVFLILSGFQLSLAAEREGGVSGGGGNFINPTPPQYPAHEELVENVAKNALTITQNFILKKHRDFLNNQLTKEDQALYGKLFSNSVAVREVLIKFRPKLIEHRSCFDSFGNPVDASISEIKENKFCFSSMMLRLKVTQSELRQQAIALMVHEYSELMGATEDEAVLLQESTLLEFSKANTISY